MSYLRWRTCIQPIRTIVSFPHLLPVVVGTDNDSEHSAVISPVVSGPNIFDHPWLRRDYPVTKVPRGLEAATDQASERVVDEMLSKLLV